MKSEFNFLFNTNQLKNTFIPRTNKGPGFKRISLEIYIQGKKQHWVCFCESAADKYMHSYAHVYVCTHRIDDTRRKTVLYLPGNSPYIVALVG